MPERKPPRMRAACGHCHSAKVKCSGERSGCTRCQKLGLECSYGVSMVGRASKRKNPEDEQVEGSGSNDDLPAVDANGIDFTRWPQEGMMPGRDAYAFSTSLDPTFQLLPQDLLQISGLDDFHFHAFPDSHTQNGDPFVFTGATNNSSSSPETNMPSADHNAPAMPNGSSLDINDLPPNPGFPPQPITLSNDYDRLYNPATSLDPIFVFVRIQQYLENQMKDDTLPLDKTLGIVKSALKEVMKEVGNGSCLVSLGCRALTFAAIQTIVQLYSRALAKHRMGATGQPEATFKLGSFEIDPEDVLKLQNQAIAAELGRCIRDIKALSQQWAKACSHGENCKGVKAYHNMEKGLQEMREDIESGQVQLIDEGLQKISVHDKRLMHPLI